jgi:hypothetical protein
VSVAHALKFSRYSSAWTSSRDSIEKVAADEVEELAELELEDACEAGPDFCFVAVNSIAPRIFAACSGWVCIIFIASRNNVTEEFCGAGSGCFVGADKEEAGGGFCLSGCFCTTGRKASILGAGCGAGGVGSSAWRFNSCKKLKTVPVPVIDIKPHFKFSSIL